MLKLDIATLLLEEKNLIFGHLLSDDIKQYVFLNSCFGS